jgi:hypothetical protein
MSKEPRQVKQMLLLLGFSPDENFARIKEPLSLSMDGVFYSVLCFMALVKKT